MKEKKVQVFDFLNDISFGKEYLFDGDTETVFNGFIINMGLMQHTDALLLANETNKMPTISKLWHHDYLFHSVDKRKRFGKWAKADKTEDDILSVLMNKYSINREVAKQYLGLLSEDDKKNFIDLSNKKGGTK